MFSQNFFAHVLKSFSTHLSQKKKIILKLTAGLNINWCAPLDFFAFLGILPFWCTAHGEGKFQVTMNKFHVTMVKEIY